MIQLNREFFINSFYRMADLAEEQRDHWTELDSAIGDGDHGINLSIGFRDVKKQLDILKEQETPIAAIYKKVGMSLMGKVGGASGPLYGSFFMKSAANIGDKTEITLAELVDIIKLGVEQIIKLGKAQLHDKTMLDAFIPGLEVINEYDLENDGIKAFEAFVARMKQGSDETIPLVCNKGRALRLGDRAIGHRDPGSESAWMLMNCYLEELKKLG